MNKEADRTVLH